MHCDMLKHGVAVVEKLNSYLISNAFSFEFYSISSKTVYIFGGTEDIFAPLIYLGYMLLVGPKDIYALSHIHLWWEREIFMPPLSHLNPHFLRPCLYFWQMSQWEIVHY